MSDSSPKRVKARSVAAFLFLPQFHLCFRQFAFIVPVFIRTIAIMFTQAGLLPQNHPATQYGVEGVKKFGFFELMGEAWYTLRSTSATPVQWSLFAMVLMVVVFTILSCVTVLCNISGLFIGTASAQIFDSPFGPTDMDHMPPANPGGMFDYQVPAVNQGGGAGGYVDYGIIILDKLLRQGMMLKGGPLQNALGGLMQVYNTGMLAIAGVMLFWAILAIVLDTAKTGQIGGGRHNMVWAPIRIVVGLGLLIPLGASGFSSGQFMVMKLAEWGSNFGSRGWMHYVDAVARNNSIVREGTTENATGLVQQYTKMWVCRTAYNGYIHQAGAPDTKQLVASVNNKTASTTVGSFSFTNKSTGNLCGTVSYPIADESINVALGRELNSDDTLTKKTAQYKKDMLREYAELFVENGNTDGTSLARDAKEFSCAFVSQYIYGTDTSPSPLRAAGCSAGLSGDKVGGPVPTTVIDRMVRNVFNTMHGVSTNSFHALRDYAQGPQFMQDMDKRGWAGMGVWYYRIRELNSTISSMKTFPVTIENGSLNGGADDSLAAKTKEILGRYAAWWQTVPQHSAIQKALTPEQLGAYTMPLVGADRGGFMPPPAPSGKKGVLGMLGDLLAGLKQTFELLFDVTTSPLAMVEWMTSKFISAFTAPIYNLPASNEYVLTKLSNLGDTLMNVAISMYAISTTIGVVVSLVGWGSSVGLAIMMSPLMALFNSLASAIFLPGVMLHFWLPMLPLIRVAFAALTWMIAVFEAVAMVPVAALTHLSTEGEGIGGQVRNVWILWLNILLRPILTVIGFVGALLVFNTFVGYFHSVFLHGLANGAAGDLGRGFLGHAISGINGLIGQVVQVVIYVGVLYTVANSTFKMLDLIPHGVAKYMGGHADTSFDQDASSFASNAGGTIRGGMEGAAKASGQAAGDYAKNEKAKEDKDKSDKAQEKEEQWRDDMLKKP